MNKIVKIEDLDISQVSFVYKPQKKGAETGSKGDFFWLNYKNAPVLIQFPKDRPLFKGASDFKDNKNFTVSYEIADKPEILQKMKKLEEMCQTFAKENLKSLKISKKMFKPLVKYRGINGEPTKDVSVYENDTEKWQDPMLTFRIDFEKSEFIHDKKKVKVDSDNIQKYLSRSNEFLTIVNYYGWVASDSYGITGKMIKTKVWGDTNANGITFLDESDIEENEAMQVDDSDSDDENIVISDDDSMIETQ